ncbi:MAG: hypothetical protein GY906_39610, partial [bacterium]|nr:hypothetical protein [bacterium]
MDTFDRNWRELQLETLVDLSLTIGGVLSEEELVDELLQRAVGTLDARVGCVATTYPGGHESVTRSIGMTESLDRVRTLVGEEALETLVDGQVARTVRPDGEPPYELVAVPLVSQQQNLGMAVLGDKETRAGRIPFSEGDGRLLLS